jgi:hypothetical protein
MTCEDVKKELALSMLGLGSPNKQRELGFHAESCPACAQRLEKALSAKTAIARNKPVPPPDWEASWQVIEARVQKKRFLALPALRHRWALVSAVVTVFILGAVAGRIFLVNPTAAPHSDIFSGMNTETAWHGYADRLELLLVDFGNRIDVEPPPNILKQEKALIERILVETRALNSLLAREGDKSKVALLNDAELLLMHIANLRPGDKKSAGAMAKVVRESPLKSKLRAIISSEVIF